MLRLAIPLLHVSSSAAAEDFYCNRLGFRRHFSYRVEDAKADPCFMGLERDGVWLHVSSFSGDGVSGGVAGFLVDDVDALHSELVAKDVAIELEPTDQTWGNREMYVKDADGNSIRFIRVSSALGVAKSERLAGKAERTVERWRRAPPRVRIQTDSLAALPAASSLEDCGTKSNTQRSSDVSQVRRLMTIPGKPRCENNLSMRSSPAR